LTKKLLLNIVCYIQYLTVHQEIVMNKKPITLGVEYYTLVGQKDAKGIKAYLHPNVEFTGPLATLKGKDAVSTATSNFMQSFTSLTIRSKFGSDDQAMVVYESDIPGVANAFPGASLMTFQDGLITKIELFYDGSFFLEKKEEIFS